jgi:ribonucleoside-diphosphate reductase alpha chain
MSLMTGAGVGVAYGPIREENSIIHGTGGFATGPIALMQMFNESGRGIMQGGSRRAAIWAGLPWWHGDIHKFIRIKDWSPEVRKLKEKDFSFPATLDHTNISVQLDESFFAAYDDRMNPHHSLAHSVYWATVEQMLKSAEPGFSVDVGENAGEDLRNACTEVTSRDSDDVCNLASINMGNVDTLEEFAELVRIGIEFLLAGTIYSDVPHHSIDVIRAKNRRLGLGLMGIHEWLLKRGKSYGPDDELAEWLAVYRRVARETADKLADLWRISRPQKVCAIAPTGTIGIVAETTTGIEPIFCVAYKRRYLKDGKTWVYQYVVDPVAKRLIDQGIKPEAIEDAYSLAHDVEQRLKFQAFVQEFVDHGISSTVNLPHWGSKLNNKDLVKPFGNMLINYLPKLRGMTVYPDGARGGQPLTPVKYQTAIKHEGAELVEESVDLCDITGKGSCG